MELTGKVKKVLPLETGESKAGKTWKRQDFVVEFKDGSFDKIVVFTARNDSPLEKVSTMKEGSEVKVAFNVESREYNGKYYTNLTAWKIDVLSGSDLPF